MLGLAAPTAYDLRFRLLGVPVRIHPLFWLVACLLGGPWLEGRWGAGYLLLWVACVFVSILVHELGHVLAGRAFGARGHILLYSFGGLAIGRPSGTACGSPSSSGVTSQGPSGP